jgi:hypothetical protein
MENSWLRLADSYQFSERPSQFITSAQQSKKPADGSPLRLPSVLGELERLGLLGGELPRLRQLHPLLHNLRVKAVAPGLTAAPQEQLMALRGA